MSTSPIPGDAGENTGPANGATNLDGVLSLAIVEPHHHYLLTSHTCFQPAMNVIFSGAEFSNLKSLPEGTDLYSPSDFVRDCGDLHVYKSVHLEVCPADPLAEAIEVEKIIDAAGDMSDSNPHKGNPTKAIVAACDLSQDPEKVDADLKELTEKCPHVVGIRYIVDYAGPFGDVDEDGKLIVPPKNKCEKTMFCVTRHSPDPTVPAKPDGCLQYAGVDFLRGLPENIFAERFEKGYSLLAKYKLRFDLQCAPDQLLAAADLIGKYPDIPVVLDHFGKPRLEEKGEAKAHNTPEADATYEPDTENNEKELAMWREGMKKLADLPNVYVKLSMLAYVIPGSFAKTATGATKESALKALVLEVIDLFGAKRCMFSGNWWRAANVAWEEREDGKDQAVVKGGLDHGGMANSDGRDRVNLTIPELWARYWSWVKDKYSEEDIAYLFSKSAEEFYGI